MEPTAFRMCASAAATVWIFVPKKALLVHITSSSLPPLLLINSHVFMCSSLSFLSFFPVWTKKLCWCWCWCCWWLKRTVCLIRWIKFVVLCCVGVVAGSSTRLKPQTSVRCSGGQRIEADCCCCCCSGHTTSHYLAINRPQAKARVCWHRQQKWREIGYVC